MTQVYATLRSDDQYLIARKQITNAWWSGYAAPVLVAEAASALTTVVNVAAGSAVNAGAVAAINASLANAVLAATSAWPTGAAANGVAARTAINQAAVAVNNAGQVLAQLQAALPTVLAAVDRAAAMGAAEWVAGGGAVPAWVQLQNVGIPAWPDPNLQATVNAAQRRISGWAGSQSPRLVNQAGQWALPGGRMSVAETAERAARREFQEETGVELDAGYAMAYHTLFQTAPGGADFYLVCFDLPGGQDIADLVTRINANLMAQTGWLNRPTAGSVVDWELDAVCTVAQDELSSSLGTYQPVSIPDTLRPVPVPMPAGGADIAAWERRQRRFAESQSIDWYLRMARYIEQP